MDSNAVSFSPAEVAVVTAMLGAIVGAVIFMYKAVTANYEARIKYLEDLVASLRETAHTSAAQTDQALAVRPRQRGAA